MELLVVIAIIALLAAIIMASLTSARAKARTAKLQGDMHTFETKISTIRTGTLLQLTSNGCTACSFNTTATVNSQAAALSVNATSWQLLGFSSVPIDPWGNPYIFDENELEFGNSDCRFDVFYSSGLNGIWEGFAVPSAPDVVIAGVGDDYAFAITHGVCNP